MSNTLDLKASKIYNPNNYETFDDNLADMLIDVLSGDKALLDKPEIQALGVENIKAALQWLKEADVNGDYKDLLAKEGWRLMYKRKPPSPEEFLTTEWIGSQAESLWPNVRKAFIEFMDPNPLNPKRGLALSVSIGWGKSLLSNLCMTYILVLFCLMRDPYKLLGHSQPVYEKIKLANGKYTTIEDLKIGMELKGVTSQNSKVIDIIEQGEKDTYELQFENNLTCRCSLDHLWTVWDTTQNKYIVLPTKIIIENKEKYLFPEIEDCKRDKDLILKAEKDFLK